MGVVLRALERRNSLAAPSNALITAFGGRSAASGVSVTEATALTSNHVWACVNVIAGTISTLPLHVYRRLQPRGKLRADEHPLSQVLHSLPNPEMSAVDLRMALTGHLLLWGNGYAEIVRNRGGQVIELWPLRPDCMRPARRPSDKALVYYYQLPAGETVTLPAERVLHLRGLSFDGLVGYSPIALAREAIGLGLATEEFGARFFGNGARPMGVLEFPGAMDELQAREMRDSWQETYGGLSNAHRVAILQQGVSYKQVGVPPEDAQFLATRKFQLAEVARIFRVPPHKVGDLERATFSNIEHQSIEFVTGTIQPWLVLIEQAIFRSLLGRDERQRYFAEHLIDGLLRGDITSRYNAYAIGRGNGWLSANDVREKENMNPIPNGDIYLVPLNMIPADQLADGGSESDDGADLSDADVDDVDDVDGGDAG